MFSPKEKAGSAIQRDSLTEFLHVASIYDTGCFYFALLMSWNYLYPDRVIDRRFAEEISRGKDRLVVSPREVVSEVKILEPRLGLRVANIGITQYLEESVQDFRDNVKVPPDIGVSKIAYPTEAISKNTSALVLWVSDGRSHYTSVHPNSRFSPEEVAPYHPEYAPATLFFLEPSEVSTN